MKCFRHEPDSHVVCSPRTFVKYPAVKFASQAVQWRKMGHAMTMRSTGPSLVICTHEACASTGPSTCDDAPPSDACQHTAAIGLAGRGGCAAGRVGGEEGGVCTIQSLSADGQAL
eukprot:1366178-Amphidinium_carterae.1